jgi:hypothetical protein
MIKRPIRQENTTFFPNWAFLVDGAVRERLAAMSAVVQGQKSRFVDPETLPPKPIYVFRGHVAEITALRFIRNNTRLVSG